MQEIENSIALIQSISDSIIENISDTEMLKSILDASSELLDVSVPGFKLVHNITNRIRIEKFWSFLSGIYIVCKENNIEGIVLKQKLIDVVKRRFYSEYITNVYESAINSKSIKNTAILGYYLASNIFKDKDIEIEQIIICKALKELSDIEIEIFRVIYSKVNILDGYWYYNLSKTKLDKYTNSSVELVIESLKNYRIFGRGIGSTELTESAGICLVNEITDHFYNLINDFYKI